jgi:hypothetical protein
MENNHPLISSLTKASGALLILSVFVNIITLLVLVFRPKNHLFALALDCIDALFILGPEVMWTYMFMNLTKGPGRSVGMGPGLILLWVAFVMKILADLRIVKFCGKRLHEGCRPRRRSNTEQRIGQCLEDCECCFAIGTFRILEDCLRW